MYVDLIVYVLYSLLFFFFFKQKTAYEMRISDWSSDVCSSDLVLGINLGGEAVIRLRFTGPDKPAPGTPVTVKMGMGDAVLSLLNNITVQPINGPQTNNNGSGNEVGTSQRVSDIVGVLDGENQVEFRITPSVAFDGLKIHFAPARSDERRVGKERVSTCRSRL